MTATVRDIPVEVCDGRLSVHFRVAGDGPPLVFFHPLPGLEWQTLLDRLAGSFTVYAPEHPGTTPGDPQAIREVHTFWELLLLYEEALRVLELEQPAFVGMSFGGMVAADLAASFPSLPGRLVLLSPIGLWRDEAPIRLVETVTGPPEALPGLLYRYPDSEEARKLVALPSDPDEVPRVIAQSVWNVGCTTKFAWPIADHGLERRLHRIAAPTLLLWGRDDGLVPVSYAAEFGRGIAGCRVEVLEDCGHVMQCDQPERTLAAISEFLGAA